jgi:hypothetical protein
MFIAPDRSACRSGSPCPGPGTHQPRPGSYDDDLAHSILPWKSDLRIREAAPHGEHGRTASEVSTAADDHLVAKGADDITDGGEPVRFRLAPTPEPSGLGSQPCFSSLILPGLDFSRIAPALSAITSKVAIGPRIVPELNCRGLLSQVDYTSFVPKIDLMPAIVPELSSVLPKFQLPWAQQLSGILRPLLERLPPNWPDDIDLGKVETVIQEDGLPIVWVPRAEIVTSLLAAPDRAARIEVLLAHEREITADCRAALGSISLDRLSGQLPLAVKALDAFEAGHYEAAQALAAAVTETAVTHALGDYAQARQKAAFDPRRVTLRQLRVKAALAPIGPFYTAWYPSGGTPAPEALSRHVTIHQADQQHYTRGNAAVAVLLTTSVLRALQELAEEPPGDPDTSRRQNTARRPRVRED